MSGFGTVVDLFAGVGGLSLGAVRAGFNVVGAVELDPYACSTHELNFPATRHLQADISSLSGDEIRDKFGLRKDGPTGLIGGPPCQGFSMIGRRSVEDPRNTLLSDFFRLVAELRPMFFVAENVPNVMSPIFDSLLYRALGRLPRNYVLLPPFRIRASDFGVPTVRTRVFFVGFDSENCQVPQALALANLGSDAPCVGDALAGLPTVRKHWLTDRHSWQEVGDIPRGKYFDKITSDVPPEVGAGYALDLYQKRRLVSGCLATVHSQKTIARFSALRPGEIDKTYRSRRLSISGLCPTLRAGTGADRGSFQAVRPIHPRSDRVITTREAARLQGFPDWFQFHRTRWHSFRQIGNSVSPIVAESIFVAIAKVISSTKK